MDIINNSPPISLLGRTNQKRRFGSPTSFSAASSEDQNMDCSSSYTFQATKRRKRFNDTSSAAENNNNFTTFQSKENWSLSPFATTTKPLHEGTGKLFLMRRNCPLTYIVFIIAVYTIILTIYVNCCNYISLLIYSIILHGSTAVIQTHSYVKSTR